MTWSRRVSRAAMVRAARGADVVAAGSAGFVDELFAPQLAQVVAGLADGVAAVIDTGEGVHLGGELGDGEPVRRRRQRQGGAQRVTHAGFVEVDTADPGGAQPDAGGQLVEDAVAEESGVHAVQGGGEPLDDAGQFGSRSRGTSRSSARSATRRCCARSPRTAARVRLICVGDPRKVCVGDPRKGGIHWLFSLFGLVPARAWGGGPQSGSRWSARSAARTNDLEADEDPPHTWSAGDEAKTLWFKSSAASRERTWCGRRVARAGAQPYLGPRTRSGDMMMDGVPDVRAAEGVRPLSLSGKSTQQRGGDRTTCGSWPQASAEVWAGHAHNAC